MKTALACRHSCNEKRIALTAGVLQHSHPVLHPPPCSLTPTL